MFGSIYSSHLDVLRQSLYGMNDRYRQKPPPSAIDALQRMYIRFLGVPEIGLRLRAIYFDAATSRFPAHPARVLDAGSGIGAFSVSLAQRYPNAKITGCDIDATKTHFCASLARELQIANLQFVEGDVTDLGGFTEPFDLIVCIDVLEHIADYKSALSAFGRVLRPGGMLYLHTPQANQKRIFSRFRKWQHEDHVREGFSPEDLRFDLEASGFAILEMRDTFGVLGRIAWELNHLTLGWNPGCAAVAFPILLALTRLDPTLRINHGLGLSVTAIKRLAASPLQADASDV